MENKKQAIILSGVAIVALLALIIGATYAYFRASGNSGSNTDINVTTYTLDLLLQYMLIKHHLQVEKEMQQEVLLLKQYLLPIIKQIQPQRIIICI